MLSVTQAQWQAQLERFGMTQDQYLKPLLDAATKILGKEKEYVQKLERSRWKRIRRRVFPGRLTCIFDELLGIVKSGPDFIATRVENHALLIKYSMQTPASLPFDADRRHVPLKDTVAKVKEALEDPNGLLVVTVWGGPGVGKSSLVKYIAIEYERLRKKSMPRHSPPNPFFAHGVHYLFCGKGARDRLKRLQLELLESLGFADGTTTEPDDPLAAQRPEAEFVELPSHRTKLRFCLAEQKLLIILDDVWEMEVVQNLVFPSSRGVRYLVTSQIRGIWDDATQIELKTPSLEDARKILANCTKGLPEMGVLPDNIKNVTDSIIRDLEYHPLSLANVGISINQSRATDPKQWEVIKTNLHHHLDENYDYNRLVVCGRPYGLRVSTSMMVMVDSLPSDARRLMFLLGLLEGSRFPEFLVKFFYNFIQSTQSNYKYNSNVNFLEQRSLVELVRRSEHRNNVWVEVPENSRVVLVAHTLRMYYIRKQNAVDIRSMVNEILGAGDDRGEALLNRGDSEKNLPIVMAAVYCDKIFMDAVAPKFQNLVRIFNGGLIPRSMGSGNDALDLVERAQRRKDTIEELVWLLNIDGEGTRWKQQAHVYTSKIITKFICQRELDDESMAKLLQLPETTSAACTTLKLIYQSCYASVSHDPNTAFSRSHGETMDIVLALSHDNGAMDTRRAEAIRVLPAILENESKDMILSVAEKWNVLLAKNSNPVLQMAVVDAFGRNILNRASLIMAEFPGVLEQLLTLMVEGHDDGMQANAAEAIRYLSGSKRMGVRIGVIPGALETLLSTFQSSSCAPHFTTSLKSLHTGWALTSLSRIPENRTRFKEVQDGDGLKRLVESLASCQDWDMNLAEVLFEIWGNLALDKELRETITTTSPEFDKRLRLLQMKVDSEDKYVWFCKLRSIYRTLTIFHPLDASPIASAVPPRPFMTYFQIYAGRIQAYTEMRMYKEAIRESDMILHHASAMTNDMRTFGRVRHRQVFLKTMVEDYAGAMVDANYSIQIGEEGPLGERGVLHRISGELTNALKYLNASLQLLSHTIYDVHLKYDLLKNRGFTKHLMGDDVGARADAESALELSELNKEIWKDHYPFSIGIPINLVDLPVEYLGFVL